MSGPVKKKLKKSAFEYVGIPETCNDRSCKTNESNALYEVQDDVVFIASVPVETSTKTAAFAPSAGLPFSVSSPKSASSIYPLQVRGNSFQVSGKKLNHSKNHLNLKVQTSLKSFFKSGNDFTSYSVSTKSSSSNQRKRNFGECTFLKSEPPTSSRSDMDHSLATIVKVSPCNENFTYREFHSERKIKKDSFNPNLIIAKQEDSLDSSDDELLSNLPDEMFRGGILTASVSNPAATSAYAPSVPRFPPASNFRKCPFYKLLPGTFFAVDAFNFGVIPNIQAYMLSHFHSDHYIGLTKKFARPIFCSRITATLVKRKLGVDPKWINELPMNSPVIVHKMEVTLLDANHCPGSVLFLIKLPDGRVYLHTGDFRADPKILSADPHLQKLTEISKLYLDTTYLDPSYCFESQDTMINLAAELAVKAVKDNPKTLIICGTYSVGKEKIFMRIANAIGSKVAVTADKLRLLECFEWKEFNNMLTKEWSFAQVHVLPMQLVKSFDTLEQHLAKFKNFNAVLAIAPSGWEHNKKLPSFRDIKPKVRGVISILGLPYSEHSSYKELEWFVQHFHPKEVIPTVNVGIPKKREAMQRIISSWLDKSGTLTNGAAVSVSKKQNLITDFFIK